MASAVRVAAGRMQETTSTQLAPSLEVITKKFTEDLNFFSIRLEGRLSLRGKPTTPWGKGSLGQIQFHEEVRVFIQAIK